MIRKDERNVMFLSKIHINTVICMHAIAATVDGAVLFWLLLVLFVVVEAAVIMIVIVVVVVNVHILACC